VHIKRTLNTVFQLPASTRATDAHLSSSLLTLDTICFDKEQAKCAHTATDNGLQLLNAWLVHF